MDSINEILKSWRPVPNMFSPKNHHRQYSRGGKKPLIVHSKCLCGAMRNYLDSFLIPSSGKGSSILWYLDNIFNDVQCCFGCNKLNKTPDELAYEICCKPRKRRKPKKILEAVTPPIPVAPWTPLKGSGLMCGRRFPKSAFDQEEPSKLSAMPTEGLPKRRRSVPKPPETPTWRLEQERKIKEETEATTQREEEEERQRLIRKLEAMVRFKLFRESNEKKNQLRFKRMSLADRVPTPYRRSADDKSLSDLQEKKQQWKKNMVEKSLLQIFKQTPGKKKPTKEKIIRRSLTTPFGIYDFMERSHKPNFSYRFSKMLRQEAAVVPEFHPTLKSRYTIHGENPRVSHRNFAEKIGDTPKEAIEDGPSPPFKELLKGIKQPKDHPILASRHKIPIDKPIKRKATSKSKTKSQIPALDNLLGLQKSQTKSEPKVRPKFTDRFGKMLHGKTSVIPELHPNFRSMHDMNTPSKTAMKTASNTSILHKPQLSFKSFHKLPSGDKAKKPLRAMSSKIISGLPTDKRHSKRKRQSMQSSGRPSLNVSQDIDQISMIGEALGDWEPPLTLRRSKPGIPKMRKHHSKSKSKNSQVSEARKAQNALSQLPASRIARLGTNTYTQYRPDVFAPYRSYSNPSMATTDSWKFLPRFRYKAPDLSYAPRAKKNENETKKSSIKDPKSALDDEAEGVPLRALRKFSSYIKNSLPDRMIVKRVGSKTSIAYLRSKKKPTKADLETVSNVSSRKSVDSGMLISSSDILKTNQPPPPPPPKPPTAKKDFIKQQQEEVELMFASDAFTPLSSDAGTVGSSTESLNLSDKGKEQSESDTPVPTKVDKVEKVEKGPTRTFPISQPTPRVPTSLDDDSQKGVERSRRRKRKTILKQRPSNTLRVHIKEHGTYSESEPDNVSKHSSRSVMSMEEVGKEIDKLEARAREKQSQKYTKQHLHDKFTMEEREKLNKKIREYMEQCAIREDYQVKKPPRNFVEEGKKLSLTPPLRRSKRPNIPVRYNRWRDKFPTVLEIFRIPDLASIKLPDITEELYKQWTDDYPTDWTYPLLEPLKIRRYVRSPSLGEEQEAEVDAAVGDEEPKPLDNNNLDKCGKNCYCSVCDFFKIGMRTPDSPLIKRMKRKWRRLELIAYYRLKQLREREKSQDMKRTLRNSNPCGQRCGLS